MKTKTYFFFLFASFFIGFLTISFSSSAKSDPVGGTPITTITSATAVSSSSLTAAAPVSSLYATVTGTQVTIQWTQAIGTAELMIEDQTGQVVVDDMVNTNTTSSYTIDMTGFESGTYTVILQGKKSQLTTTFTLN
ncbi:MAG: DUF3244 domain-containing protein [Microbacter sp.]